MKCVAYTILIVIFCLNGAAVRAQTHAQTIEALSARIGLFGGYASNGQSIDLSAVSTGFGTKKITSSDLFGGGFLDFHLSQAFALHLRGSYNLLSASLAHPLPMGFVEITRNGQSNIQPAEVQTSFTSAPNILDIMPGLTLAIPGISTRLTLGFNIGFVQNQNFSTQDELVGAAKDAGYVFAVEKSSIRNHQTANIPTVSSMLTGVSGNIAQPFNISAKFFIQPEIQYTLYFSKISEQFDWKVSSLRFGLSAGVNLNKSRLQCPDGYEITPDGNCINLDSIERENQAKARLAGEVRKAEELRKQQEEAARNREQARLAEEARQAEELRKQQEEAARNREQARLAEEARKAEELRKQQEEAAHNREQARLAEEARKAEELRKQQEEAARNREQARLAEEARKAEELRKQQEEAARNREQARLAEEARKAEELRKQQEEAARNREQARLAEEARKAEELRKQQEETTRNREQARLAEEARKAEELRKQQEEAARNREQARLAEEARKAEELRKQQEEAARNREQARLAEEARKAEELRKQQEEAARNREQARLAEEARKAEELRKQQEEAARNREQARLAEEARKAEELRKQQEEAARNREQARLAEEVRKAEELRKQQEEAARNREQARLAEEARKAEELRKQQEEAARNREQARLAEEARKAEELRKQHEEAARNREQARLAEEARKAEELRKQQEEAARNREQARIDSIRRLPCPANQIKDASGSCVDCPPGFIVLNGECVRNCGTNQQLAKNGVDCECLPGFEKNPAGDCVPKQCPPDYELNAALICVPKCPPGRRRNIAGDCEDLRCPPGEHRDASGNCIPKCNTNFVYNPKNGQCEPLPCDKPWMMRDPSSGNCIPKPCDDKRQIRDSNGNCNCPLPWLLNDCSKCAEGLANSKTINGRDTCVPSNRGCEEGYVRSTIPDENRIYNCIPKDYEYASVKLYQIEANPVNAIKFNDFKDEIEPLLESVLGGEKFDKVKFDYHGGNREGMLRYELRFDRIEEANALLQRIQSELDTLYEQKRFLINGMRYIPVSEAKLFNKK